jgi:hypothetical protein
VLSASFALTASHAINITVSGSINGVDYIDFDTTMSYTNVTGRLGWDSGEHTLQLGLDGGVVQYSLGEQLYQYCYNAESTTLTKGEIVYVSGSQGNQISVKRANNSGDDSSAGTLGFVAETIISGGSGWILTEGVLRKLNTNGLTAGGLLYLGATPGTYTQTPPVAPSHSVRLGYVERVNSTVGSIYVKIDNGYEIGELHDVVDNTTTTTHGDLLIKSGSVWRNAKQLTGSYGLTGSLTATQGFTGSLFGTASWATQALTSSYILNAVSASFAATASNVLGGAANYIPLFNTATSLSSSVIYQSAGNIGIGTISPDAKLTIQGSLSAGGGLMENLLTLRRGFNSGVAFEAAAALSLGRNTGDVQSRLDFVLDNSNGGGFEYNSTVLTLLSGGNVGIGTTSPSARLHVSGSTTTNLLVGTSDLFVSSSGNVGIGTNTPVTTLQVNGTTRATRINSTGGVVDFDAQTGNNFIQVASSNMSFANNGAVNAYISSSGNVGIGTTSPGGKVHIKQIASEIPLILDNSNGTSGSFTQYRVNASSGWEVGMAGSTEGYRYYFSYGAFGSANAKLAISSSGNVGIGTTSPSARLHVAADNNGLFVRGANTSPFTQNIAEFNYGGNNNSVVIKQLGGVASITTSPNVNLQLSASGSGQVVVFDGKSVGFNNTANSGVITLQNTADSGQARLDFITGSTTVMSISASGNVGIGTTSPIQRLHVVGNGYFTGFAYGDSYAAFTEYRIRNDENNKLYLNGGNLQLNALTNLVLSTSSSFTERVRITIAGDVGIGGISPLARLHVSGSTGGVLEVDGAGTAGSNALYVSASGNVGIGTATPGARLVVSGSTWINQISDYGGAASKVQISAGSVSDNIVIRTNDLYLYNYGNSHSNLLRFGNGSETWNIGATTGVTPDFRLYEFSGTSVRFIVQAGGNVGIGTASPNARLDVSGSAIVSGSFTVAPSNAVELQVTSTGVRLGNVVTDAHTVTGSLNVGGGITGSFFGTSSWSNNSISASFAVSAAWAPTAGTTVFPYTGSALFTGSITLTGSLNVSGSATITDSLTIAGSTFSGSVGTRLSIVSGTLSIAPYTSSGMIRVSDASGWPVAANYTYPQLRLPDYRTGITLVSNNEVHIVCDSNGVMSAKSGIGNHFINLDSTAWLRWSTSTTNGFTHDIILKRESAGVLAITGSIRVSGSVTTDQGFTGSLFGTSSWAVNALTASSLVGTVSSASFASTASFVNTLNQNVVISGSFTVFTGSAVELQVTNTGVIIGNSQTDVHQITGNLNIQGNIVGAEPIPAGAKLYLYYNY